MDREKIPENVMEAIEGRGLSNAEIQLASADNLFDEFCNWHGFTAWGPTLRRAYTTLKEGESQ